MIIIIITIIVVKLECTRWTYTFVWTTQYKMKEQQNGAHGTQVGQVVVQALFSNFQWDFAQTFNHPFLQNKTKYASIKVDIHWF